MYGSVARGEDEPHSDIDVAMVVSKSGPRVVDQVREALQPLGDRLLVHFSVVALTPAEVAKLAPSDHWAAMSRDAKILKGASPQQEAARCARTAQHA